MPLPDFKSSTRGTMGVELELQLIDPTTFDLTAASPDLLFCLAQQEFPGVVTPEVTQSMIEVCTSVHYDYSQLLAQLHQIRQLLQGACSKLNIAICGGGTHPFQSWTERRIFAKERFQQLSDRYGYLAKQFTVFGQHIHIGCQDGDEALYLLHALSRYIPHFIALAASSPFVQGRDTCFNSARLNSVFAFPLSGHAPFILDWDEFAAGYFTKMERTGTVASMKDFYWDLRPKPEYGTLELRVCDTPLSVTKAAALAGYLQALCQYLLTERPQPDNDDYLVYNHNRFQACRFGLSGTIVDPRSYAKRSIAEDIQATLGELGAISHELASQEAIAQIASYLSMDNDADYLRKQQRNTSLETVVSAAIHAFNA